MFAKLRSLFAKEKAAPSAPASEEAKTAEATQEATATDATNPESGNTEAPKQEAPKPKHSKNTMIIVACAAVIALAISMVAGWMMFNSNAKEQATQIATTVAKPPEHVYLPMQEFVVNLKSNPSQPHFLKVQITLEFDQEKSVAAANGNMPIIRNSFNIYLSGLTLQDVQGSAALDRLRDELLLRLNMIMYPITAVNVLFDSVIAQ